MKELSTSKVVNRGHLVLQEYTKKQKELRIQEYNKHPKICSGCGKPIPYEKRKFNNCSKECGYMSLCKRKNKDGKGLRKSWTCPFCKKSFTGKLKILNHRREEFEIHGYYQCEYCSEKFKTSYYYGLHLTHCTLNPQHNEIQEKRRDVGFKAFFGKKHTEEEKAHLSEIAKKNGLGGYFYSKDGTRGKTAFAKSGKYKGIWCDSSWELAFVVYNLEHGIQFEKNFEYFEYYSEFDKKNHKYYPDFKLDENTYLEIKGWMNDSSKIKINEFRKNYPNLKLEVYGPNEMKPYLEYVRNIYGKNFYKELYED